MFTNNTSLCLGLTVQRSFSKTYAFKLKIFAWMFCISEFVSSGTLILTKQKCLPHNIYTGFNSMRKSFSHGLWLNHKLWLNYYKIFKHIHIFKKAFDPVILLTSSKGFFDIQATIECGFILKRVRDMTRIYRQCIYW